MKRMLTLILVILVSNLSYADSPQVEQRQQLFEQLDEAMDELEFLLEVDAWSEAGELSNSLYTEFAVMSSLFPESTRGEGRAKNKLWSNWDDFSDRLMGLRTKLNHFSKLTTSADTGTLTAAYDDLKRSCKGCHRQYRARK
ncbi:MAG: cytochrome c [Oceanospirillaceae bacterium]|nr:cytochrome c [Oceanospirillaceae bacterium]